VFRVSGLLRAGLRRCGRCRGRRARFGLCGVTLGQRGVAVAGLTGWSGAAAGSSSAAAPAAGPGATPEPGPAATGFGDADAIGCGRATATGQGGCITS
jgi:hypothetical protein